MKRDTKIAVMLLVGGYGELNVEMCIGLVVNIRAREDRDISRLRTRDCHLGRTKMMVAQLKIQSRK